MKSAPKGNSSDYLKNPIKPFLTITSKDSDYFLLKYKIYLLFNNNNEYKAWNFYFSNLAQLSSIPCHYHDFHKFEFSIQEANPSRKYFWHFIKWKTKKSTQNKIYRNKSRIISRKKLYSKCFQSILEEKQWFFKFFLFIQTKIFIIKDFECIYLQ